ncbi:GNAT family N-acetyltransferase [Streptomyces sp. SID13031]|uniref:GNAT family N-acetyltransferase n=1 Tax=Streptomyces sp. SID13031 TaxID=2706046 RepID=UPI0013CBCFDA|nr:GNAT family N-acetyltransferase [Streptomyces sp. SID13031]NEA34754.1 GNAT family N-acetyltransferase [Streptomyces sp. SID13031]
MPVRAGNVEALTIRPATVDDLKALHGIAERAVFKLLGDHWRPEQLNAAREARVYEVEPELVEAGRYYVVEIDGVVVAGSGWSVGGVFSPPGHLTVPTTVDEETAIMRAAYVDPDWSRRGLMTLLVHVTETLAKVAGFRTFEALCTPAAEAFLTTLGYHLVERVPTTLPDGTELMGARMRKLR